MAQRRQIGQENRDGLAGVGDWLGIVPRRYGCTLSAKEGRQVSPPFQIVGPIEGVEVIAIGARIRCLAQLVKLHGGGRWRKMKGVALVRLRCGRTRLAELHWYDAHGIGRVEIKLKRYL